MNSINEHVTDGSSLYCKSIYQPDKSKLLSVRGLGFHPESRQMERVRFLITTSEGRLNCLLSPRWLCFLQFVCWCLWFRDSTAVDAHAPTVNTLGKRFVGQQFRSVQTVDAAKTTRQKAKKKKKNISKKRAPKKRTTHCCPWVNTQFSTLWTALHVLQERQEQWHNQSISKIKIITNFRAEKHQSNIINAMGEELYRGSGRGRKFQWKTFFPFNS